MSSKFEVLWDLDVADKKLCPEGRESPTACLVQNNILIFGGYDGNWKNDVWLFDLKKRTFLQGEVEGKPPIGRSGHTANLVSGNKIVIYGGFNGSDQVNGVLRDVVVLEEVGTGNVMRWFYPECSGSVPPGREGHTSVMLPDDRILFFGGYSAGTGQKDDMFCLDTKTWKWENIGCNVSPGSNFPLARSKHACIFESESGYIYVFGGDAGSGKLGNGGETCRKDIIRAKIIKESNTLCQAVEWEEVKVDNECPEARNGHSLVRQGQENNYLLFGGTDGELKYFNEVWTLCLNQGTATWEKQVAGLCPKGREWHTTIWSENKMIIFGGCVGSSYINEVSTCSILKKQQSSFCVVT